MKATDKIELVIEFLERKCNLMPINEQVGDGNFNRTIKFNINGVDYFIEWWVNQCYLRLTDSRNAPHIPFKHIRINSNSPTMEYKYQLCFFDKYEEGNNIPFGSFKIPFNLNQK